MQIEETDLPNGWHAACFSVSNSTRVLVKLWRIMGSIRYSKCAIIDWGGRTGWFDIKSGVRQGCVMSGFLFLIAIDWVKRKTFREGNTGIRWRFTEELEDLDFTDDLALLSSTRRQLQLKNERLSNASKGTGLKINITKTKVMRFNAASEEKIIVIRKQS